MIKKFSWAIAAILLTSCSTSSPPRNYQASTPQKQVKELFHETIGLVISYKQPSAISFSPQSLKPLTRNFLDAIHAPVRLPKKQPTKSLFTKNAGHDKFIKFFLPLKLQSIVHKLSMQESFTFEVISQRGRHVFKSSKILIKDTIKKAGLIEVHLGINDIGTPLSPSETIHLKLPIGKKEQVLIPASAIYKNAFVPFVYIINDAGHLEKRSIKIENSHDDMISIAEGLNDHPKVAVPNQRG